MQEYTLKTKFAALEVPQAIEYLMDFGKIIEKAFEYRDSRPRLLGNLLCLLYTSDAADEILGV